MNQYFIKLIRWPSGCLIFFLVACQESTSYKPLIVTTQDSLARKAIINRAYANIFVAEIKIKNGDLVTRIGNDFTSECLRLLNQRDKTYSHCGIASIEHDSVFVYHALGGEWNPDQKIRRDPFVDFADPYNNRGIGLYNFGFADSMQNDLVSVVKKFYTQGIRFDMDFDLKTDDRMYCAEFIYKSIAEASAHKILFHHSFIKQFEFIGVDDIFLYPGCTLKQQIIYK